MDIMQLAEIVANSGALIGVLIYFCWYNSTEARANREILEALRIEVEALKEEVKFFREIVKTLWGDDENV